MNKTEIIRKVAGRSGINEAECIKVLDVFEEVISDELSYSGSIGNAFDRVYKIMVFLKKKKG